MPLSLVVIFTQSIQLSKIVKRLAPPPTIRTGPPWGGLSNQAQDSTSATGFGQSGAQPEAGLPYCVFTFESGGAERDRTVDPLLAKQVLSQLSYSPIASNHTRSRDKWWAWVDSNYRPHPYQGCALTN